MQPFIKKFFGTMVTCGLLTVSPILAADPIYRTSDEFGRPVFTDQGSEDADVVELNQTTPFSGSDAFKELRLRQSANDNDNDNDKGDFQYTQISITDPPDGAAIRDNAGNLTLTLMLEPPLQDTHRLDLLMNGAVYQQLGRSTTARLTNVDRGTNSFALRVTDTETGKVIVTGPTTSITFLRHSVQH